MERGEVYYIRYNGSVDHEEAVGRPVVVVGSDDGVANSDLVQALFMSTSPRNRSRIHIPVFVKGRTSYVLCNQINALARSRFDDEPLCKLTDLEMEQINKALLTVLGLRDFEPVEEKPVTPLENVFSEYEAVKYKALYERALSELLEVKYNRDSNPVPVVAVEPVVEEPVEVVKKPKVVEKPAVVKTSKRPPRKEMKGKGTFLLDGKKANVNKHSADEICNITGMSHETCRAIVAYRRRNGNFTDLVDLLNISRFGNGCFNKYIDMLEL